MPTITIERTIPGWASMEEREDRDGTKTPFLAFAPGDVYPKIIDALGMKPDRVSAEIARRCAVKALSEAVGGPVNVHILKDDAWRLDALPKGAGDPADVVFFHAHYAKVKGLLLA
jgi:hypothetical protein